MGNIIEELRKQVIDDLFTTNTMKSSWLQWKEQIRDIIGDNPTPQSILNLGDYLRSIFQSTGTEGRGQSDVSAGGTAWESLITWYVNLCCVGTRVIAIKKMGQVPTPIKDAITVNYSNFSCTTESDITVIVFPNHSAFTEYNSHFITNKGKICYESLNETVSDQFSIFQVGIIQCKTNWNDNAQIPMLWDMIYSAGGFRGRQITVGNNGYSIQALPTFTYAFVTVPSNKLDNYKNTSLCVKRVYGLSGGNYWGLPSLSGVARSIKEIFQNYRDGFQHQDIKRTLNEEIPKLQTKHSYFNI